VPITQSQQTSQNINKSNLANTCSLPKFYLSKNMAGKFIVILSGEMKELIKGLYNVWIKLSTIVA